ncbi:M16 family metallopeptidase [Amycolatopsis sp. H20-H5]|uniref:M16 family metallopeptidase n=1 Tax=Amycolatopsis sp. H20-H5 TaxID=3046309 RepID=UPI002DBD1C7F|nr:pitrilysin family protein [Amycolatopsis sp. H20-H5]MEC3975566.1 pitrilysin family protein [Amycolatopsis sp. H20-H5]
MAAPDDGSDIVAVTVVYDVGSRTETPGFSGFAHLFEHLMFQGSDNAPRGTHARQIQSCGGVFNATTHLDYTEYYQLLPSTGLEHALYLEADRMRSPAFSDSSLRNQIAVVAEEITGALLSRPYGGFPWLQLAPVLFKRFENAHNGYGSIEELRNTTVRQAKHFFHEHYGPGNALLVVAGAASAKTVAELTERHFGDIPARSGTPWQALPEPPVLAERRAVCTDPLAPVSLFASGWRVPDPVLDLRGFLAFLVLCPTLADGTRGRLSERLVFNDRLATGVTCRLGLTGETFGVRDPTCLVLTAAHATDRLDSVLAAVDEEIARLADRGPDDAELTTALATTRAQLIRSDDALIERARRLAIFGLQHRDAALADRLPAIVAEITASEIRRAATELRAQRRATVELLAGATK